MQGTTAYKYVLLIFFKQAQTFQHLGVSEVNLVPDEDTLFHAQKSDLFECKMIKAMARMHSIQKRVHPTAALTTKNT